MSEKLVLPVNERDHIRGNREASATLVEYGDFECPFCRHAYYGIKQLESRVGDEIQFVFRNFPLTQIHPHAFPAAMAAESAGAQGKFWEMHDLLFENQDALEDTDLLEYASELGLNLEQFASDMQSARLAAHVREDFMNGARSDVNGTPAFYINGYRHDGPFDSRAFQKLITRAVGR